MANYCENNITVYATESEWKEITEALKNNKVKWPPSMEGINIDEYTHIFNCCTKWSPTPWDEGQMEELSQKYPGAVFQYIAEVEGDNEKHLIWFCDGEVATRSKAKKKYKEMIMNQSKRFIENTKKQSRGLKHSVKIMQNGKVAYEGINQFGECNVIDWEGIKQISTGNWHTVGLKSDGTVIACGTNANGQCDVSEEKDVVQISCGRYHSALLLSNGTVKIKGKLEEEFQDAIIGEKSWSYTLNYPLFMEIEGTAYENRNDHIELMVKGESLSLIVDKKNKYYKPVAIEVFNSKNETVGYLADSYEQPLSIVAQNIKNLNATVETVTHVSKRRKGSKYSLMTVKLEEKNNSKSIFEKSNYKTWKNIIKIYSIYDAVYGVNVDGKIFYDGYCGDIDEKDIEKLLLI